MNARHLRQHRRLRRRVFTLGCGYGIKTSTDYDRTCQLLDLPHVLPSRTALLRKSVD